MHTPHIFKEGDPIIAYYGLPFEKKGILMAIEPYTVENLITGRDASYVRYIIRDKSGYLFSATANTCVLDKNPKKPEANDTAPHSAHAPRKRRSFSRYRFGDPYPEG